ncbi:hypothetical protein [Comamonas composti]|uniref:hypothetical protein n=1 Tax=Comamonas composti TaxID=408558 RepID=UPI00040DB3C4|nr:hypothetical protein [Comamonas composti]
MNNASTTPAAKPAAADRPWPEPTLAQQKVLNRIALQRERLAARASARAQAKALSKSAAQVSADAPLMERITTFARLHPMAVALAGGAALIVGPRKLIRVGTTVTPWVLRLIQRYNR